VRMFVMVLCWIIYVTLRRRKLLALNRKSHSMLSEGETNENERLIKDNAYQDQNWLLLR
jgi:hypothetical protein